MAYDVKHFFERIGGGGGGGGGEGGLHNVTALNYQISSRSRLPMCPSPGKLIPFPSQDWMDQNEKFLKIEHNKTISLYICKPRSSHRFYLDF